MAKPLLVQFLGGSTGEWGVIESRTICGPPLSAVERVEVCEGASPPRNRAPLWTLRGVSSHQRYTERREADPLRAQSLALGRSEALRAALIPITKSAAWWELAQDERRAIFEERSQHIAKTREYLPMIARRLHHGRDLGEPFDFVTWFEFAPEHTAVFDELVGRLRATEEWRYVEREVDLRLAR